MYHDSMEMNFKKEEALISFLDELTKDAEWIVKPAKNIQVVAAAEIKCSEFGSLSELDIYKDTLDCSGLYVKVGAEKYPVGTTAMKTIYDRCRLHGAVLGEVEKPVLKNILNEALPYARGNALINVTAGKVRAVHAGDDNDYCILPINKVFRIAAENFKKDFKRCEFAGAFFDHMLTTAKWKVADNGIADAYRKLVGNNCPNDKVSAVIKVNTSDVGLSGANIYYELQAEGRQIFCGRGKKLEHKNHANLEKFEQNVRSVLSCFKESIMNMESLKTITIRHSENCMIAVMKRAGISTKLISETVELRRNVIGKGASTALDLYFDICQCVDIAISNGLENGRMVSDLEEKAASCLFMKWKDYDIAETIKLIA